jgi:hypothetical protein
MLNTFIAHLATALASDDVANYDCLESAQESILSEIEANVELTDSEAGDVNIAVEEWWHSNDGEDGSQ